MHEYDTTGHNASAVDTTKDLGHHKHVYRMKELEERFQLSPSTIKQLVRRGAFGPILRVGRAVRIPTTGVEAFELGMLTRGTDKSAAPQLEQE